MPDITAALILFVIFFSFLTVPGIFFRCKRPLSDSSLGCFVKTPGVSMSTDKAPAWVKWAEMEKIGIK